ncbi:MAG: GldG family protein, partial [Sedimentisphaerales bacterium]|nr:GldG family protein [Sedimentisphaerales bacterium]
FFFGLVVQTQFGVEKAIEFFSPDRQNFVEYDISYLIDTAITRQKTRIGVLSSLPVMGDDMSGYMAQMMRMQGQQPRGPWTIVEQLRRQYEVNPVPTDVNDINDVDILLVIHPKDLPDRTLLAIDQFVLKGGRTVVCVDPHCLNDQPAQRNPMMPQQQSQKSDLNKLMRNWGVEMPENGIAGDLNLALAARMGEDGIVGFLGLRPEPGCFNKDSVITAELNQVTMLFAGELNEVGESIDPNVPSLDVKRTALVKTTNEGNVIKVDSPYELMFMDPGILRNKFNRGVKPVIMGYLLTGKFKTAFPNGVAIEVPAPQKDSEEKKDDDEDKTITKLIKPELTEADDDCAVVVFSDVDFLSDRVAYRESFFGSKMVVGDNSALLLNAIDDLSGSSDLVSIRSRGNFRRPFTVVDAIEKQAEEKTAEKMKGIEAAIAGYNAELQKMVSSAKEGEEEVLGNAILKQRRDLEQKIYDAERQKRVIRMERREGIDGLGRKLQRRNTLMVPAAILIVAVVLGTRRNARRRHYISHASDA